MASHVLTGGAEAVKAQMQARNLTKDFGLNLMDKASQAVKYLSQYMDGFITVEIARQGLGGVNSLIRNDVIFRKPNFDNLDWTNEDVSIGALEPVALELYTTIRRADQAPPTATKVWANIKDRVDDMFAGASTYVSTLP